VNLILLSDEDFIATARARLLGRRLAHVRDVHRARIGDRLRVGRVGGRVGEGRVVLLEADALELEVSLDAEPPPPLELRLAVALPRPPSLRKVLQGATSMGVKQIVFFQSARVERSYWQSRRLEPASVREDLWLGLEQARDTHPPEIRLHRHFDEFMAREVENAGLPVLFAHPEAPRPVPRERRGAALLVIGPEGGLLEPEVQRLEAAGGIGVTLGPRVLRVEQAVIALIARLCP
jgi:RsmE family RNA methyltransferase